MGIASACSSPPHFWSKQNKQNTELNHAKPPRPLRISSHHCKTKNHNLPKPSQTAPSSTVPNLGMRHDRSDKYEHCQNTKKPSETETIWNSETKIFLTAKVPNWAINCSYLHLSTSSVLEQCTCSTHPTPIPFECASQTAQSAHWHSTTSYHCDICMSWVAKTRASNPTRCRDAWRGSYSEMFKYCSHTSTLAVIEPWDPMRLNETSWDFWSTPENKYEVKKPIRSHFRTLHVL